MRFMCFICLCLFANFVCAESFVFSSVAKRKQFNRIINEVRCVVCQNQSIAESNAPLAKDLQRKIYDQLAIGKSECEIKDYLVLRYGDSILFSPPFNRRTLFLWAFPFLLMGCLVLFLLKKVSFYPK